MAVKGSLRTIELPLKPHRDFDRSKNFDAKCETDIEPKSELYNLIEELFSGSGDTALFYYSGHGCSEKGKGYLVTPDCKKGDWGVPIDDLINMAKQSNFNPDLCRESFHSRYRPHLLNPTFMRGNH